MRGYKIYAKEVITELSKINDKDIIIKFTKELIKLAKQKGFNVPIIIWSKKDFNKFMPNWERITEDE